MAGADLLVTKPGGLIVSEGLAKGLPMALIGPSAGQERANTELLLAEAVAVEVTRPGSLCRQIRRVIDPPHRLVAMAERARTLGHPNSAMDCANLVKRLVTGQ
jgi:processive 1,2-diacylglycerol beta-glucosyltransferase